MQSIDPFPFEDVAGSFKETVSATFHGRTSVSQ